MKTGISPVQLNLRSRPEKTYINIVGNMMIEVRILSHFFTFSFFRPRSSINSAGNKIELTIRMKSPRSNTYQAHFQDSVPAEINRIAYCKIKTEKTWIKRRIISLFTLFLFHIFNHPSFFEVFKGIVFHNGVEQSPKRCHLLNICSPLSLLSFFIAARVPL